jgi:glutamine amidotransferase-like uncharacterized protein
MFRRFMWITFVPVLLILIIGGTWFNTLAASPNMVTETTQRTAKVAVYGGPGVWESSRIAIVNMYEWVGASVTVVYNSDVIGGGLVNYDVFVMPGGNSWDQYVGLGYEKGASKIRDFVSKGGGYIGICAGAYLACDYIVWEGTRYSYPMGLFPGHGDGAIDEIASWPYSSMTNISIVNHTHPITKSLPDSMWILYYGGPEFYPYAGANVTILGRYQVNGEAAIVACQYGSGKVFLTGPHPEIEEYNWPLMHAALYWMTASPPTANFTYSPANPIAGKIVTFNASNSQPGWNGTHPTSIVDYCWDFGDQTRVHDTDPYIDHIYAENGTYTVTLNITDSQGFWNTTSKLITVNFPVGSIWIPVDKLALLAPYIVLASTIVVATVVVATYFKRIKRRKEKHYLR